MVDEAFRSLLRGSDGETFQFVFVDGDEMMAVVVSGTHVDLNDTLLVVRSGAPPEEMGYQIGLADLRSLRAPDGTCLYLAEES